MFNFNQTKILRSPGENNSNGNNDSTQNNAGDAQGNGSANQDTGSAPTTPREQIVPLRSSQNQVPGAPNIGERVARPGGGRQVG